ncbi:MAG: glycosyltransferase family 39 protein [Candidatus Eisenbacteria sp.]|nr:glycosyltransferase family 39 protein [Candidatus Eisenbacteria bacterium]
METGSRQRTDGFPYLVALLMVLVAGAALRFWGLKFGLPAALLHLDEPPIVLRAQRILETGDWNPHWFHYPSLYIYVQVALQSAMRFVGRVDPFLLARISTAVAGILTIWVTWALGSRMYSRTVGLVSALFLAVNFLHARESHFATVDGMATLWVSLCIYLSLRASREGGNWSRDFLLAAVMVGLAAGTKYNAALVGVVPLAVVAMGRGRWSRWIQGGRIIAVAMAVFLASTPYAVADWATFLGDVRFEIGHYREGHFGFEGDFNAGYFAGYLFSPGMGEGVVILVLLGLVRWAFSRERVFVPALVFLALYYASISAVRVNFVRNLLPVLPVLCLLGARGLDLVLGRLPLEGRLRTVTVVALVTGLVVLPLWRIGVHDRAISNSTRVAAGEWIEQHVPAGSTLAIELYGPDPIPPGYRVIRLLHLPDRPVRWYEEQGVDYLIASSGAYEMAYSNRARYPEIVRQYEEIFRRFPVVMEFEGEGVDPLYSSICPTIRMLGTH